MIDAIKYIELIGEFKSDKIYYLYKTSSSEINLETLSQLQNYESSLEFFSHYTKVDIRNLINSINKLDKDLTSIFSENSNNFLSNTEKYISQISKLILLLNLIIKLQEILNKNLINSKKYLEEISNNCKIDNIYQDKFLSLINNLEHNFPNNTPSINNNFSVDSTKVNSCNKNNSKILPEINDIKIEDEFFNTKKLSIVNEEILSDIQTPAFIEKKSNKDNISTTILNGSSNNSLSNYDDFNLTFRDMIFILDPDSKTNDNSPKNQKSNYEIEKPIKKSISTSLKKEVNNRRSVRATRSFLKMKSLDEESEIKMYTDFLLLVQKLYKSCLITTEERIGIKKLIISKSKKIIDFYKNEYENIKDDYLKSANAIKNLL